MSQAAANLDPKQRPETGRDVIRACRVEFTTHLEQVAEDHRRQATAAALNFARYPDDPAARSEAMRAVAVSDDVERFARLAVEALQAASRRALEKQAGDIVEASVRDTEATRQSRRTRNCKRCSLEPSRPMSFY
ncbi:MAG: hypothetical protein ACTHK7_18375, partial [Aureliella sp.]